MENSEIKIDVEARVARAEEYFKAGYNCAQAVVMAFDDVMEQSPEMLARLAAPFGGGMGRMRQVCGAVSGAFILAGLKYGYTDPNGREENAEAVMEKSQESPPLSNPLSMKAKFSPGV